MESTAFVSRRKWQICIHIKKDGRWQWRALPTVYNNFRQAQSAAHEYAAKNGLRIYDDVNAFSAKVIAQFGMAS